MPYAAYRKIVLIAVTMTIAVPVADDERGDREQPRDDDDRRSSEFAGVR